MTDAGFFKGTTAEQDNRFADKKKKLMKCMRFCDSTEKKVDMSKVNLETIKPWITEKITELLGFEDDVVIEFIFNQLEERQPDGKEMQINLTGFLNAKNARIFIGELWELLLSAMDNIGGIPARFVEQKKEEIKKRQAEQERIQASLKKKEEEIKDVVKDLKAEKSSRKSRSASPSSRRKKRGQKSPSKSPRLRPSRSKSGSEERQGGEGDAKLAGIKKEDSIAKEAKENGKLEGNGHGDNLVKEEKVKDEDPSSAKKERHAKHSDRSRSRTPDRKKRRQRSVSRSPSPRGRRRRTRSRSPKRRSPRRRYSRSPRRRSPSPRDRRRYTDHRRSPYRRPSRPSPRRRMPSPRRRSRSPKRHSPPRRRLPPPRRESSDSDSY